ncbi:unnamed protein product [Rotaria magnacalcarata]|uniref:Uncharacterized protein n=1 Tax=Rotaria magnacalcarata TaxID=392030 RepID=A0A8S2UHJ9_9BILA|nr:unnamed protein product [Rotaria magnacalcarata]
MNFYSNIKQNIVNISSVLVFDVFTRSQTITTPKHIFISSATNTKDSTTCLVAPETHLSTSPSIAKTTSCVDVRQALTEYFLQNPLFTANTDKMKSIKNDSLDTNSSTLALANTHFLLHDNYKLISFHYHKKLTELD